MNKFEMFGGVDPHNMTPEQIALDEAAMATIREKNRGNDASTDKPTTEEDFELMIGDRDAKINARQDRLNA